MRKTLLFLFATSLLAFNTYAQDFKYGNFSQEELGMKSYDKDTSAHAVVLQEFGRSEITPTTEEDVDLVYEYHVKIKIFDKRGFDEGSIEVPYYSGDGQTYEKVDGIQGKTTYTDENGSVQMIELDPKKIYETKDSKHWNTLKFAMPGLRNGCIIEYKYRVVSPYYENFHPWEFQSNIPKIYSEYDVHIPGFWTYNASLIGALKPTKSVAELERGCFSFHGATCDCSHFVYGMSNIPAFIVEDHMTSPRNFISAINFELSERVNLFGGGGVIKIARDWKDVDYELKHSEYFGTQLKKQGLFKDKIAPVIAGKNTDVDKAKAIYDYIKKTIKWNEVDDFSSGDGIRKALDAHSGNAGEINISLAAALNAAGLNTEVVILSTRAHGFINKLYPVITGFNYAVVKLNIGDKTYLLDATEPLLPFGTLPLRCLNDQGRVMSLDKPSYWIDMNTLQKKTSTYRLDLTLQKDGTIKGTMIHYSIGYEAYEKREEIKKFNSVDEYVENLNEKSPRIKIKTSQIANLDSLDLPLSETYELEIKEYNSMDHERLAFNPFIMDRMSVNPFKLADRTYPVDWGMPSATRFTLVMHVPDDYTIETSPKNSGLNLPNEGGSFITSFETDSNTFTFSHVIQLNKSIYSSEEYPYLKEFYNKIILSEKSEIIFKKKT